MKLIDDLVSHINAPPLIPSFKQVERRLLSVFMSLLDISPEVRGAFLSKCGYGSGRTSTYQSFMEISYKGSRYPDVRPDGLIVCQRGKKTWAAFIEAKAENKEIRPEQIQDYAKLADMVDVPTLITISNEFARQPEELPYHLTDSKRKGRAVFHFAWADIRTFLELMRSQPELTELEQKLIQHCLAFFWADGSGVKTYDSMPQSWPDFVEASSTALGFNQNIKGLSEIVHGWQQERRDLCSKLTRLTTQPVEIRHHIGTRSCEEERLKADKSDLANAYTLTARYFFPSTKNTIDLHVDLRACRSMAALELKPPEEKGAKAVANWLAQKLGEQELSGLSILFDWPGRNNDLTLDLKSFLDEPTLAADGRKSAPRRISLLMSRHGVRRFKSRKLFIEDVEDVVFEATRLGMGCGWIPG